MKLQIQGINTNITDSKRGLISQKLIVKLDKLLAHTEEDLKIAHVKLEQRSDWGVKVAVDLKLADQDFYAEARRDELVTAVVEVREELERQIKEFKQKTRTY